ncbi:MAG: hypothetical protein NTX86_06350 [Candidatus Dependentiae bacterium]|nr:hypothetical protein [Candidatus Dependentiae bacterium]
MYFLPRSNAFYSWATAIKPFHFYAITAGTLGLVAATWFLCFYLPIGGIINQEIMVVKQLQMQCSQLELMQTTCNDLATLVGKKQALLDPLLQSNEPQEILHDAMMFLIGHAKLCGLTMRSCTIDDQLDKHWYIHNNVSIDVRGSFAACMNFFDGLYQSDSFIAAQQTHLTRVTNDVFNLKLVLNIIALK